MPDLVKVKLGVVSEDTLLLNLLFGAIPALIAMVFGPMLGSWSDRTRTRFGRRIPFLLVCIPFLYVSILGIAYSESIGDAVWLWSGRRESDRHACIVACLCACWILYEVFTVSTNALWLALINDTVPRRMIGRFFGMFRIISLSVGAIFFYAIFIDEMQSATRTVLVTIATLHALGFLVVCFVVKEPPCDPPVPSPRRHLLSAYRPGETLDRSHLQLFFALAIGTVCVLPVNINSIAALPQFDVDHTSYGRAIAIAYSISIVLALPIGWLADKLHPLRVGYGVLILYAVCMLAAFSFVGSRMSFLVWLVVHSVLAGAFLTGTASLLPAVLAHQHFSELAAISASVTALMTVIFTMTLAGILVRNGHNFRFIFLASGLAATVGAISWHRLWSAHRLRKTIPEG